MANTALEGRTFMAPSGQYSWEIFDDRGLSLCGGAGHESDEEAWQAMHEELTARQAA